MMHQRAPEKQKPVSIEILDKTYHVVCEPGEEAALVEAAEYLDIKMREIRKAGRLLGNDRMTLMAALNISNELLQLKADVAAIESAKESLDGLADEIEQRLSNC